MLHARPGAILRSMNDPTSIAPLWIVRELARSVRFYVERLGFELRYQLPEEEPFFAIVGRGPVMLHLKELGPEVVPMPNARLHEGAAWDAFVHVTDPQALARDFAERGLTPAPETAVRDDGLLGFVLEDPDGYRLFLGRPR